MLLSFSMLSSNKVDANWAVFSNYYVLGRRGSQYFVNPVAVTLILSRIYILLKNIILENQKFQK